VNGEHGPIHQEYTRRFWITGRVQGVGYRFFVERCAHALSVRGWVRNRSDGRVEVLAHGTPDALFRFEASLHSGPPGAQVEQVIAEPVPEGDASCSATFEIRRF